MDNKIGTEEESLPEGFAAANHTGQKYGQWKLKPDSSLIRRILPPMKSLAKSRDIGMYWKTHWGWAGVSAKNPKGHPRPFLCTLEKRNGMITERCAACELIDEYKNKVAGIQAKGKELGKTPAQIKKATEQLDKWLYDHNNDGKFRLPCMSKQGEFGIMLINYTLTKKLRKEIEALMARKLDPAGRKGVWFEFTRTGPGGLDSDNVTPCRITREQDGAEFLDYHVISNDELNRALTALPDLMEDRERIRYRPDQIEALIALTREGNGVCDPADVDRVLEIKQRADAPTGGGDDNWGEDVATPPASTTVADDAFDAPATPPAAPRAAAPAEEDEEAVLMRRLAEAKAKKAAAAKNVAAAPAPTPPPVAPAPSSSVADDEIDALFT